MGVYFPASVGLILRQNGLDGRIWFIVNGMNLDKRYKIFTYEDMIKKTEEYGFGVWENYKKIRIKGNDKPVWVDINDIKRYNLHTI